MTTHPYPVPADRQQDELVARVVFGGPRQNIQWYWWSQSDPSLPFDPPLYAGPRFTTKIEDAWLVVERMEVLGFHPLLWHDRGWKAAFSREPIRTLPVTIAPSGADWASPASAICQAALEAV